MARKNVAGPFLSFDDQSLGADATSAITDVTYLDNIGILVDWSGTAPVGELIVECANPPVVDKEADYQWTALDFGSTITISGASGSHAININQVPYSKMRLRYVRTSGTGSLTARLTIKQVGG